MIARVAVDQWGVVDMNDLREIGLSRQAISKRVAAGRLFPIYRGVWAVGHPRLSLEGRFLAAVKACGAGAALSHYCAAVLWGLRPWIHRFPDVTSPTLRRQKGINHHRSDHIEATVHRGIPVVTPARAIFDIAPTVPFESLRGAVNHGMGLGLIEGPELVTYSGRGAKQLREVVATAAPTRSENENLVLHLIHEAQLPRPLVNSPLKGTRYIPDFLWPDQRLILEADSKRFHGNMIARADDATRQLLLEELRFTVIRTTWIEATTNPGAVQKRVAQALSTSRT
ncbi:type IV toxin-antitoxin system AbiEi family antitoxin domain-containing protein [Solirubrobacter phytolaccae]|uniref:Type IV toxin-antitoxin system AbiEi family antitoxin domain-containing protein n=1 Tax=Solirubrobacter phytolaccae TaxID=1404360 RepID=A0A9X3S5Y6_9ACTN|nr:type IV toxin-antitoxin system AbiEi family antitoxin domain-containing protein [Solirubrobacter phytolaccae]MDA0179449.1 type IV toxin-antitoxin system AbiEi family antitoxin domain-containing protein [Solirubrobacter phytolaccae]